ncbi:MAG: hypothetical protein WEB60_09565 [Terrimicrobiaceae bacterium]
MKTPIAFCRLFAVSMVLLTSLHARTWKEADSDRTLEGEYSRTEGDQVVILRGSGQTVKIPFAKLTDEDKKFVEEQSDAKTATAAIAAIAGAKSTTITIDTNSSLKKQGWKELGGIAPTVEQIGGKNILVFDDQSVSDSSGCIYIINEATVKKALENGFTLTFTLRWEGQPVPHTIELLLGDNRIFLALSNTAKEQAVVVLGYSENVGGKVSRPTRFHTWKLISTPQGAIELQVDGKKVADVFSTLPSLRNRKTGSLGIGGVHGSSKERIGRLEVERVSLEILD